jgi:hypothetical protein
MTGMTFTELMVAVYESKTSRNPGATHEKPVVLG